MSINGAVSSYTSPWRLIAEPHHDVASGQYRQAEFAADLSQVIRGTALMEYQDPVEFFARTYITEGMKGMLSKAVMRVAGKGGEPVIQLKTAFGGGKTHSMLALYHMMRAAQPEQLNGLADILEFSGVSSMPKVKVAVLVGTALDPAKARRPANLPGISINTLWGEIAAQLAEQSNDVKLYNYVKEADGKGISPGSDALCALLNACGPCLILIDELVAYVRKIYGYKQGEIIAGTFEGILSFIQELTEAARKSKNSIVVAAIPESEIEKGGDAGAKALDHIEHIFGRMEAIWKPVVAEEGFEIVRRRLFKTIKDQAAVEKTCNAYFNIYQSKPEIFPASCHEADYLAKIKKCYPIHPEIFDRLYNDWATIEHFQKTRGVLRLMAAVIYDLYSNNDASGMILPGSIAIGKPAIRDELTRYLSDGWNPIIESEVDGKNAMPSNMDAKAGGYHAQFFASSRVARTIFLGSAPDAIDFNARGKHNRGISESEILLGVMQPEEIPAIYKESLNNLTDKLTYLYSGIDKHYWYDTRPTLKKTVADRAALQSDDEIFFELEKVIKGICKNKEPFEGVHVALSSSGDMPDNQAMRLVLLAPGQTYKQDEVNSLAVTIARDYFENRGNSPRIYRNMLCFLAADSNIMAQLKQDMRILMAWRSINRDTDTLMLDNIQQRETKDAIQRYESVINDRIQDAYQWLIVPAQSGDSKNGIAPVGWNINKITGQQNPVSKAAAKMRDDENLIDAFSPKILQMEMMQFNLWKDKDSISIRELWEDYTRYVYLHRLRSQAVLFSALQAGISSGDYFAYADGQDDNGKYSGLILGQSGFLNISLDGYLVKLDAARKQFEKQAEPPKDADRTRNGSVADSQSNGDLFSGTKAAPGGGPTAKKFTHFYGTVTIEPNKLGSTAGNVSQEVLQHLALLAGSKIKVTMDIDVELPNGASDDIVRIVKENCKTLKFTESIFE
ncbi:MAG: DUF499 domain-containing protein [Treponema sp.]|jgi:predicted AAA+ superfamily ATPase|nr:DUF499 domain-containing protein [Treponema sp.]